MSSSPPPSLPRGVEGGDPELARRVAKLRSSPEVTEPLAAERRLDRLLERAVDAALLGVLVDAGVWRETARAA
jgi:hypothetical protein